MTSHMGSHMGPPTWDSHMGSPTDGRTDGRTYEESFSPTRDNPSSFVTRTRTYEIVVCPICSSDTPAFDCTNHRPRIHCSIQCSNESRRIANLDVDDVAVFRLLEGWVVKSTRSERIEAVRVLSLQGRSAAWIADYLRITERTIVRYRAEITTRKAA